MVSDDFFKRWPTDLRQKGWITAPSSLPIPQPLTQPYNGPTKEQFEELLELLRAAKKYDTATGQDNCELENKKDLLRNLGKYLGVTTEVP